MNPRNHIAILVLLSASVGAGLALGARSVLADEPPAATHVVSTADQPIYELMDGKLKAQILLDGDSVGTTTASMSRIIGYGGAGAGEHLHEGDELVYVLHGQVITHLDGKDYPLTEGMAMHIPAGSHHSVTIPEQDGHLEALVIYTTAGPEQRWKAGKIVTPEAN